MCIRERLRAVSTVRQGECTVGLARSTCPCPLGGPPIATGGDILSSICASTDDQASKAPARGPLPNPRRFDEQNPVVARAVRGYFCVLIKHQLALVSVYKKWESAPAPLLSIAHISRALHKDSASVDNRRWAWRVGT